MMESTKKVLQLCFLLQALTSVAAGDNFLYSGCTISDGVRNVLADSLNIRMQYPPKEGFKLTVEQEDREHILAFNGLENNSQQQRWIAMELIMKEKLELRFQNGTTCLTKEDDITFNQIPEKTVNVVEGKILPDCPQELPNWKVKKFVHPEEVIVDEGDEEVFSLMTTHKTLITFDVGNENLALCWDPTNEHSLVMPHTDCDSSRRVPAHTLLWLKMEYKSRMVHISNPAHDPPMELRSFHMPTDNPRITFKNDIVDGTVYVVHHLRGFPAVQQPTEPQQQQQQQHHQPQPQPKPQQVMGPLDKCMWVSSVLGIIAVLVLLIFILLAALFYNRWANARQVLLLLQTEDAKKSLVADGIKMRRDGNGRKPSLPSDPPPSIKMISDNQYLTPREFKSLRTDGGGGGRGGERVKSEHVYEDMTQLFSTPKENLAFEKAATDDVKLMGNSEV